jgi:hypothetical protein
MREAEEDERAEQARISSNPGTPQVNAVSDEALMEEMRRRTEAKPS